MHICRGPYLTQYMGYNRTRSAQFDAVEYQLNRNSFVETDLPFHANDLTVD